METNIEISLESGYIKHKDIFITPDEANRMNPSEYAYFVQDLKENHLQHFQE